MGYKESRNFSDKYTQHMKEIIGPLLIKESSFEVDTQKATDLVVINNGEMSIGCRVRTPYYYTARNGAYRDEFTVRTTHDNGTPSEYQKMLYTGKPNWCLYGFADIGNPGRMVEWIVYDVETFKKDMVLGNVYLPSAISNKDGTNFLAFAINSFSPGFLVASSHRSIAPVKRQPIKRQQPSQLELF